MSLFRDLLIGKKRKPYYCEVEYLQSDGNQWIDTGVIISTSTDEVNFNFQLITTDKYTWLMGEHDNGARFGVGSGDGSNLRNIAYGASTYKVNDTQVYNNIHYFVANSNGVYLDGTQVHAFENFTSTSTVYLFNLNISGGGNKASGKIWKYTHKRGGVTIRDMIPVLDWNYTPCMYDKISGRLFYNKGTGTFTYGREIHYVDYLESTGTQYIDTGIKLTNNYSVELDYQLTQASQSRAGLFGALNMTGSNQGRLGSILSPSNQQLEHGYGAGNDYWQQGLPDTNRHKLCQKKNETYFDGALVHTFDSATFSLAINAYLGNFVYTNYTPAKAKYYSSKWWDGTALVRDYKPAIDENGVCFWFDKVTHVIYENAGTGVFKYPARQVEYLESTGTQYIDTGIVGDLSTELTCEASITQAGTASVTNIMGNNVTSSRAITINMSANVTNPSPSRIRFGNTDTTTVAGAINLNTFYKYTTNKDSLTVQDMGGTILNTYAFNATTAFTTDGNILIYKLGDTSTQYIGKIKVSSASIENSGVLVRDFIPSYKDGQAGMLDKQNNVFYSNAGTGTFTTGKILESRWF